jgi:hypothetical protein
MSSAADIHMNGNGNTNHDQILRPRAVKPSNAVLLRAMGEEGYIGARETPENGGSTAQTRHTSPPLFMIQLTAAVDGQLLSPLTLLHPPIPSLPRESSSEQSSAKDCSPLSSMLLESPTSIQTVIIGTFMASTFCSGLP